MPSHSGFNFDDSTGVVVGPSDRPYTVGKHETASWTVCEHLRTILVEQLKHGAQIAYVTGPGAWSLIDLDVSLDPVIVASLPTEATLSPGLALWTNTDSHYPLQAGVSCSACRQTLSWPIVR